MSPTREWLNEKECKNLINQELQPYHRDNLAKFDKLFEVVNKTRGAMWALSFFLGLPAFAIAIIEIIKVIKEH